MLADAALLIGATLILVGVAMLAGVAVAMILGGIGSCGVGLWLGVTKPVDRGSR